MRKARDPYLRGAIREQGMENKGSMILKKKGYYGTIESDKIVPVLI